jgi:hypothetical protein
LKGKFAFEKMNRTDFFMYPEDVFGAQIQSASTMWERIESLFRSIRELMTASGNARSGSFTVAWSACVMNFFEVQVYNYYLFVGVCYNTFLIVEHVMLIEINGTR